MQLVLAAVLGGFCVCAAAHKLTLRECIEGSDFIKNAALSRDNGITREAFLDRLEVDLRTIRQYPPQLRWFAQDPEDETMLMEAARTVFDSPRAPESHQSDFMATCVAQVGRAGTDSTLTCNEGCHDSVRRGFCNPARRRFGSGPSEAAWMSPAASWS